MPSILITGVSSGIGEACVRRFAAAGWSVIGTVRDATRDGLPVFEGDVTLESLDLSDPGSASALATRVLEDAGAPDVLLNNAGGLLFAPIEMTTPNQLRDLYQVNVFGQVELTNAFLPAMRQRGSGTVAFVGSLGGRLVFPFFGVYNSTKHAIEAFGEGLWHELQPFGIRVKVIEPGFVETAIWGKALTDDPPDAWAPAYREGMRAMLGFERSITSRTSSQGAADEVFAAIIDESDRLRYPIAAYASVLIAARRFIGELRFMRFFHRRWMGQ